MKIRLWLVLIALSTGMVSCKKSDAENDKIVYVAIESSPKTLDPRFTTDANGQRITALLFQSFIRVGPKLDVIGDAADTWNYKDKVYEFHLKPHLKFSNGRTVTTEDLAFSFAEYQKIGTPFATDLQNIAKIEIKSNNEMGFLVDLTLKEFSAKFLLDLAPVKILPKAELTAAGADFYKNLIGTGSFSLESQTAQEITLKAVKDHPVLAPKIEKVIFKVVQDDNTRYLKMKKGELDIAQSVLPIHKIKDFQNNPNYTVFTSSGLSMNYLLINLKDPSLKLLDIRRAIAKAINKPDIIQYKFDNFAEAATSILSPQNIYFDKQLEAPAFNLEEAKKILAASKVTSKKLILKVSNSPEVIENAKVLANQLGLAGFDVQIQSYEWGTFYGDVSSGNYQIALMRWVGATDPDIYRMAFHSKELPPGRNRGFYVNKNLDTLLDQGIRIEDIEKRKQHYYKVQEVVMADLPIIPLWYNQQINVVNKRVEGYESPLNGDFTPLYTITKKKD